MAGVKPSLWDAFKQYLGDAAPGGALNPEVTPQGLLDVAAMASMPVPVVGDAIGLAADAKRLRDNPEERTLLNYALMAAGVFPLVPSASFVRTAKSATSKGLLEKIAKNISPDVQRVVNPSYWDSDVGGAAVHLRDGMFTGEHVTSNPQRLMDVLQSGGDVKSTYGVNRNAELGPGLYFSARPQAWMNRATDIGSESHQIPVKASGNFVVVDRPPTLKEIERFVDAGFSGAMIPGSMGGVPQTVVWDTKAVRQFGDYMAGQ